MALETSQLGELEARACAPVAWLHSRGAPRSEGSCGNQLSYVFKEEPASLHPTWSCFRSSLPLWICSLCFLRSSNAVQKSTLLLGQPNHVQRRKATSQQDTQPQLGGSMLAGKKHT